MSISGLSALYLSPRDAGVGSWSAALIVQAGQIHVQDARGRTVSQADSAKSVCRAGPTSFIVAGQQAGGQLPAIATEQQVLTCVLLTCSSTQQAQELWDLLQQQGAPQVAQPTQPSTADVEAGQDQPEGGNSSSRSHNKFDAKTDKGSADLYFHYYGMLQHQQNMLQDMTRTGTYHAAITENRADFEGKVVMDVGAGSGILSLFAAQAGARKVYAVEASGMANFARQLAERNPGIGKAVQVCHSKVEELKLDSEGERVDVLVSEPMGTLLVNERMLETYLYARDHFLKPGGKMFPHLGRVHVAAFSDALLHNELVSKALFWQQTSFYGIDMTPLHQPAVDGYFTQVVVDAFDPSVLVSDCATRVFDFSTMKEEELHDIQIPLDLLVAHPCTLHGVATWFDVLFNGSTSQRWLSTAPGLPATHWFQLRCVLQQPLVVLTPNSRLSGCLRLVAHERQSYDIHLELEAPPIGPGMPPQKARGKFDMKEPYYRQLNAWAQAQAVPQAATTQQQVNSIPGLSVTVGDVVAGQQQGGAAQPPGVLLPPAAAAAAGDPPTVVGVGAQSAAADMYALAV